jgi:hypothetical protein
MEFTTNYLPAWVGRALAVDVPADATVEAVELSSRGSLPWLLVVPLLLLLLAGIVALYLTERGTIGWVRRTFAIALRTSLVVLVLLLLTRPVMSLVLKRERPRGVVVLLDNSQSMTLADRRLSDPDRLRVAIARGLVPLTTSVNAPADPLVLKQGSIDPPRAEMVLWLLQSRELKLFERLGKHGPVRPYLFGNDVRGPGDDDKESAATESPAEKAGRRLLANFRADAHGTALAEAVIKVLQGKEGELPAAVVLITDGQDNASKFTFSPQEVLQEAALECARVGVPLYIWGVGTSEGGSLQLKEVLVPDTLFADDLVTVPVRWRAQGFKKGTVAITLTLGGKQVGYREVPAQAGEDLREVFRFVVPKGDGADENRDLVARIQLKGSDVFKDVITRPLRVADQKIKILYVENSPRWEFKFLQPALLRDKRVQVDFLLVSADPKVARGGPPFLPEFPRSREDFFGAKYNLVILGDVPAEYLGKEHQAWLREFVQEGGGLVVVAGRQHMPADYATRALGSGENDAPLAEVLPVEFDRQKFGIDAETRTQEYPPTLTEVGQRTDWLMLADTPEESLDVWQKKLPGFHWHYPIKKLRPAAVPLLVDPRAKLGDQPMPIMASHYYGRGQVVFMGSDETWRWRWNYQDKYFVRFWGQVIYQLGLPSLMGDSARRVQVALERSQATLGDRGLVFVRLLNRDHKPRTDAQVEATLDYLDAKDAREKTRKLTLYPVSKDRPGEYSALLAHDRPGRYELKVNNPEPFTYAFRVELPPRHELEEAGMAEKALREMARLSGGQFYREEDLYRLPDDIPPRTVAFRDRQDVMLFPLGLVAFVILITAEWLVRKFSNLS